MQTGSYNHETDVVASPPSGPARHLLKFGGTQLPPSAAGARVRNRQDNCTRGKINARGHCRGGEDRVKQPGTHQLFNY